MNARRPVYLVSLLMALLCPSVASAATQCEAYFPLDGNLDDSSANAYVGRMMGKGGTLAAPEFVDGKSGRALRLNGNSAMRALVDLNFEVCPQVTLTAWVLIDGRLPGRSQNIVSTGAGTGPGFSMSGTNLTLHGTGNGLMKTGVMRENAGWMFIAGVYDYEAGTYTLYWRNRKQTGGLGENRKPPEDALWIGALNDGLSGAASNLVVDELRVYGRTLSDDELRSLQANGVPESSVADAGPGPAACSMQSDCSAGSYCAFDRTCHPESHLPLQSIELVVMPAPVQTITTVSSAGQTTSVPQLDLPPGAGTSGGLVDPQLTAPQGLPGQELMEDLNAAQDRTPQQPTTRPDLEVYRRDSDGPFRTIEIVLPGTSEFQTITYEDVNGIAVAEGDIILGNVAELGAWEDVFDVEAASGDLRTRRQGLNAAKNIKFLWPGGKIPYTFHSNMTTASRNLAAAAASKLTSMTNLSVVPRAGEDNYVEFKMKDNDFEACSSRVGMKQSNGSQTIKVDPQCTEIVLVHEILHAAGFWHEQSRPDRDQYVEIFRDNVIRNKRNNFNKKSSNQAEGVGPYNYRSVMHYGEFNFGKECIAIGVSDPNCLIVAPGESVARTLRATQPGAVIARDLATDVDAINTIYPTRFSAQRGLNWGDGYFATATAVGDVDGDGRGEIIVGRLADRNSRFIVYDDINGQHKILTTGPSNWGADVSVTDVAVGDVDGDGTMEIGVARKAASGNRFFVYRHSGGQLVQIFQGGDDWGAGNYATSIAFGDVDGDGRNEIAVGRKAGESGRYYLFDDAAASVPYKRLAIGGSSWDATHYATAVAFGDIDNDGRDELGVARLAASGLRYEVVAYSAGKFTQVHAGGHDWGSGNYATAIAFGNVDGDDGEEIVIGRKAGADSRFYVDDDGSGGFSRLDSGGDQWGSAYYVVGVDLADVDNDGRDEIVVARNAGENGRYYVFDDRLKSFDPIPAKGRVLIDGVGATDIAAGDVDNDGKADLVVSYDETTKGRMRYEIIYLNPPAT